MSCLAGIFKVINENRINRIHDQKPDSINRYGSPDPDVADPVSLSRMLIFTHRQSRIANTKAQTRERGS
jgi:hypothetical protein